MTRVRVTGGARFVGSHQEPRVRHSVDDPAGRQTRGLVHAGEVRRTCLDPLGQGLERTLGAVTVPEEEASH
ncbi:hypothetical protein [Candidatus Solirubrobacter pratensis]|uniref:hypothetical protein n=1 Tax=Candidatus Solirubrobacter pratensis TaxID=1298857 RepID=UPI0003FF5284|nr:hypothetical protein [Candidatus Solirubrobacter pratensis]